MNTVLIIGAFDRYNYGDLLFPLIIENQLNTYNKDYKFEYFGLVKSDLSNVGGKPTLDIKQFYDRCRNGNGKVNVILAGGESVAVKWGSLISAIDGDSKIDFIKLASKYLGSIVNFDKYGVRFLGYHSPFPFHVNKSDFPKVNKVILNSLGGSRVSTKILSDFRELKEALAGADYFSVRDRVTLKNLSQNGIEAKLFPDSAILMSEFYPLTWLRDQTTEKVRSYVDRYSAEYVFFQFGKRISKGMHKQIAEKISKIHDKYNVKVCLCPIGKALAHEDDIALVEIAKHLSVPYELFDDINIWDIMYLIASSKTYVGTSLHGAITAMSYGVPYVGLKGAKVNSYLSTWGVEGINKTFDFDEMDLGFAIAQQVGKSTLFNSKEQQLLEIRKSFDNMVNLMEH